MSIRPVTREDIPAVAELLTRVAPPARDVERVERQLAQVFFEHPWQDAGIASLLAEDDTGKIRAFLGVLPRPMRFGDRRVRAAAAVRLAIHPEAREFLGTRLLRRFLDGPQDLALMDVGACATRATWERLGGCVAFAYTLGWTRPLRPAAWTISRLAPRLGAAATLARPLATLADGGLARLPGNPLRLPASRHEGREVDDEELLACATVLSRRVLHAAYELATFRWVLARAGERLGAPITRVVVRAANGQVRGCYVLAAPPGGVARVLLMAAFPDATAADDVLCDLFQRALARGCVAVRGRQHPRFTLDLTDRGARLQASAASLLVHTQDDALARHIARGEAWLGPLDGELAVLGG